MLGVRLNYPLWSGGKTGMKQKPGAFSRNSLPCKIKHEQQLPGLVGETTRRSEHISRAPSTDDQIRLREEVLSSSKVAMDNGTMTAADYARDATRSPGEAGKAHHELQSTGHSYLSTYTLGNH